MGLRQSRLSPTPSAGAGAGLGWAQVLLSTQVWAPLQTKGPPEVRAGQVILAQLSAVPGEGIFGLGAKVK